MTLLREFVSVLGIAGTIILVVIVLAALLIALYLLLQFGEASLTAVASFVVNMINVIRYEPKNVHPAIRVEFRLHLIFGAVFFLSLAEVFIHGLLPWIRPEVEQAVRIVMISSFVIMIVLACPSVWLSLRVRR